jgi:hypothetical protein
VDDDAPNDNVLLLLDESVLLYEKLQNQRWLSSRTTEIEKDIHALRESEVTALIEDIAIRTATTTSTPDEEPSLTLSELSQQLDQAMMEGYQSTFTQEELDDWVRHIDHLYAQLQSRMGGNEESVIVEDPDPLESYKSRLEQLRTLITPITSPRPNVAGLAPTFLTLIPKKNSTIAIEDAATATTTKDKSSSTTDKVTVGDPALTKTTKKLIEKSTASSEATNESRSIPNTNSEASNDNDDTMETVQAVVSVAAIGAAAVAKIPFLAAGVALGPLIKSSILYAQNAMGVRKNKATNNNKETSEEQETKNGSNYFFDEISS